MTHEQLSKNELLFCFGSYKMAHMAKRALGKGLGALIKPTPEAQQKSVTENGENVEYVSVSKIVPSPLNPRKEFTSDEIKELGDSIREHGVIQPLIVRKVSGKYELIAGERRWRASQSINLTTVPVIVREASDRDVIELALIENLQRQDLNPVEEASGYLKLSQEFNLTQEQIAKRVGKSRASVANAMRLLDLEKEVKAFLTNGQLSVGHAKVILGVRDKAHQSTIADQVIRHRLTVRQTEKAVQQINNPSASLPTEKKALDPAKSMELMRIQNALRDHFSTFAKVTAGGKKGKIELEYYDNEDLQRILEKMGLDLNS